MAFDNLEWKLIARDEASRVIDKVIEANKSLASELKKTSSEAKKSGGGWADMAKGVAAGALAYEAIKKAASVAVGFIQESISESVNAAATMELVKQNVENAGLSYDKIGKQLDDYSQKMIQAGFDDEETAASVSKLILVTGNYDQAIKLNNLSMDLARNKNIKLEEATALVTQVTQGNTKVLKSYGIELDDTANAAANLSKLQDKVRGSTEAFANTTKAKMEVVNVQWENIKQQVGDKFLPVLEKVLDFVIKEMPKAVAAIDKVAGAFEAVGDSITTAGKLLDGFDKKLGKMVGANKGFFREFTSSAGEGLGYVKDFFVTGAKGLTDTWADGIVFAADKLDVDLVGSVQHVATVTKETTKKAKELKDEFSGIGAPVSDAAKSAATSLKEQTNKIKDSYKDAVANVTESLAKLDAEHTSKIGSIAAKITDLKNKIKELNDEYSNQGKDVNKSEAEQVIAQERKIADLKKQIAGETDSTTLTGLNEQLTKEEAAYNDYISRRKGLDAELTEARRRDSLTDFERFIEDTTAKRATMEADHKQKLDLLQAELTEQQNQAAQEQIIYETKRAQYLETQTAFAQFHDQYLLKLTSMKTGTQKMVDEMNLKLKEMIGVIAQIESAKNRAGIVGAAGFDQRTTNAAAPVQATTNAGGSTITVNLGGVSVNSQADADSLVQKIVRQLQLAQVGSQ